MAHIEATLKTADDRAILRMNIAFHVGIVSWAPSRTG